MQVDTSGEEYSIRQCALIRFKGHSNTPRNVLVWSEKLRSPGADSQRPTMSHRRTHVFAIVTAGLAIPVFTPILESAGDVRCDRSAGPRQPKEKRQQVLSSQRPCLSLTANDVPDRRLKPRCQRTSTQRVVL